MSARHLLAQSRRRAGLSQRELASLARIPQSTVARIERGTLTPRVDTLERLLRAAGRSLVDEPLLGIGVDRTQIRELLQLTPVERARLAAADANAMARIHRRR